MATMKITDYLKSIEIRNFVLYCVACAAAQLTQLSGLGLILIGIWMQVANVLRLKGKTLTKESQIFYLKYFLGCVPLILIYGSVNGFFPLFWKDFDLLKLLTLNILQWFCAFFICLFMIFNFSLHKDETLVSQMILKILYSLKSNLKSVVHVTFILWGINLFGLTVTSSEYVFVIGYAITHLYWNHLAQKKPVVVNQD